MAPYDPFDEAPVNTVAPAISWKSARKGESISGIILPVARGDNEGKGYSYEPARNQDGSIRRFKPKDGQEQGDPMMNIVIWFLSDKTGWEWASTRFQDKIDALDPKPSDDGSRRWILKSSKNDNHRQALQAGLDAIDAKKPEVGMGITIDFANREVREVQSGENKGEKYDYALPKITLTPVTPENVARAKAWYAKEKERQAAQDSADDGAFDQGDEAPF